MKPFVTPDSGQRTADTLKFTNHHLPITKSLHFKPSILVFFLWLRHKKGYMLGRRPSAADSSESAWIRANSAQFCTDPPNFRQKKISSELCRTSAERLPESTRTPPRTGGVVRSKNVRQRKFPKNTVGRGRTSAADVLPPQILRGRLRLGLGLG